jgi:iron(III) transport system permease protein
MQKFRTAKRQIELLARDPLLLFLVGAIFLSLAIFVAYPLAAVLSKSFQSEQGSFSLENYVRFVQFGYLWNALWNSWWELSRG